MQTGNVQQFWWCGEASNPAKPSQDTDTILYESIDLVTGVHVGPQVVLAETPGAWDSAYTCNPRVIKGKFNNPLGDGTSFTYALYYVGTDNVAGTANSIGVAFSNDGINWKKYPSPVIPSTNQNGYGAAQPVAYNTDGQQAITLFYEDDAPPLPPNHHWQAVSSDGVHFKTNSLLTTNGLHFPTGNQAWADMVLNKKDGYWYALYNLGLRDPATTGDIVEHGQLGFQIYKIPQGDLLVGKTGWQEMKTFDTVFTGYESNFLAGILQDGYGNMYQDSSGATQVFPAFSNQHGTWNANPKSAALGADLTNWDIGQIFWSPKDTTLYTLTRWWNGTAHVVTTGWIDQKVFTQQVTLGRVYPAPQAGASVALWGCKQNSVDSYVSLDSTCGGNYIIGFIGYVYGQPPAGTAVKAIYRCSTATDHFVSTDAGCEGSNTDVLLGYILPE